MEHEEAPEQIFVRTPVLDKLLFMKKAGTQISMFFYLKWMILSLVSYKATPWYFVCISFVWLNSLWEQSHTKLMQKKGL